MADVILEGVSRSYPGSGASGRVLAVQKVDLATRDGEFLVLVGPSGCGKTTLLRLIAGLDEPTEGTIRIGQRVVNHVPPRDRNVAMVFQHDALYPHLTVYDNLAFGLNLRQGGSWWRRAGYRLLQPAKARELAAQRAGIDQRVRSTARSLGIDHLLERLPRQLSGGERQRSALGRALVREPAAFLLDEPLSNVDAQLRVAMRRELKLLHQQLRRTVIYVTHDQAEALTLGDRVAVMNRGELQQLGPPLELYDRPKNQFVAGFLGSPPMNFLPGELRQSGDDTQFVSSDCTIRLDRQAASGVQRYSGCRIMLGIRPEHVRLSTRPSAGTAPTGRVEAVELLGDASIVHVGLAPSGRVLAVKMPGRQAELTGASVGLEFEPRQMHVFDASTGENVSLSKV